MYVPSDDKEYKWENFTLVIPAVSVGNVGQLAVDLIISTLGMQRIGYIYHESIQPVVGNNAFAPTDATDFELTTSCEVYTHIPSQLVVIQQRSPFVKGKRSLFVDWLAAWISEKKFSQVYVLASTYAHERIDQQLHGAQFRYLASPSMVKLHQQFLATHPEWQPLERRRPVLEHSSLVLAETCEDGVLYMPGSGLAKQLFELCSNTVALAVLLVFCMEGDNTQDAITLTNLWNAWTMLVQPKDADSKLNDRGDQRCSAASNMTSWKIPASWRLVHGTCFDPTLFH